MDFVMLWNIIIAQVIMQKEEEFMKFRIFNRLNGLKTMMCACCHFKKRISTYLIITYNPVDDFLQECFIREILPCNVWSSRSAGVFWESVWPRV